MRNIVKTLCMCMALTGLESSATQFLVGDGRLSTASNWSVSNRLDAADNYEIRSLDAFVDSSDDFTILGGVNRSLILGSSSNSLLTISGGTMNVNGFLSMQSAFAGGRTGTVNMVGGTVNVLKDFRIGAVGSTSRGYMNMSGGTLDVTGAIVIGGTNGTVFGYFNYTGGSVSSDTSFQLKTDGKLNFELGNSAITTGARSGGGLVDLLFDGGYSHTVGYTNILIQSASKSGEDFILITDSGNVAMTNGAVVTVNTHKFSVIDTATQLGLVAIPEPATIGMLGLGGIIAMLIRRGVSRRI